MAQHNDTGKAAESQAAFFLYKKGWEILERNFDHPAGQIDIIAKDGDTYVFVEVKAREGGFYGLRSPVAPRQQRRIVTAALLWLKRKGGRPKARFDLVMVGPGGPEHFRDAFRVPPGCTY